MYFLADWVSGLHNCLEFSQLSSIVFRWDYVKTEKVLYCLISATLFSHSSKIGRAIDINLKFNFFYFDYVLNGCSLAVSESYI